MNCGDKITDCVTILLFYFGYPIFNIFYDDIHFHIPYLICMFIILYKNFNVLVIKQTASYPP